MKASRLAIQSIALDPWVNQSGAADTDSVPVPIDHVQFSEVDLFPGYPDIDHGELFTLRLNNDTSTLTHALHRFPAKFVPQIPKWALREFGKDAAYVLDPFMGSGTTLVEGLLRPGRTDGFDIDPVARLIAHGKTDIPSPERILEIAEEIRRYWSGTAKTLLSPMPGITNFGHWFSEDAWGKLQALYDCLMDINCSASERRFMLTVFSSILRWVSNADDQSQKTYVSGTLRKEPPEVLATFSKHLYKALSGLRQLQTSRHPLAHVNVRDDGEACELPIAGETVDLIVTSPPYLDSVDYMYNMMMEYFWLGRYLGVGTRREFNAMRRAPIGAKNPNGGERTLPDAVKPLFDESRISPDRLRAVRSYFAEMKRHFEEAARVLRKDGHYVLVIGNSQTREGILPVHDGLVRLAAESGLQLQKAFGYRIRRHYMKFPRMGRGGIILVDWVIVLRKVDQPVPFPESLPLMWASLEQSAVAH